MTNEEMRRLMEFIVEQDSRTSAKLDALIQRQAESKKEADQRWARTEESIRALLSNAIKRHTRRGRNGKP